MLLDDLKNLALSQEYSELQWFLSKDYYQLKSVTQKYNLSQSYLYQEIRFLIFSLKYLRLFKKRNNEKIIAFCNSKNQMSSLKHIIKRNNVVSYSFDLKSTDRKISITIFDYIVCVMFILLYSNIIRSKVKKSYYYQHLKPILYYAAIRRSLNLSRPLTVLLSNDHRAENRIFLNLQKHYPVCTVYKQHAQVSELFPNLDWNISILEGDMTRLIYEKNFAIQSKIILSGHSETLNLIGCRSEFQSKKFGVALNSLDDLTSLFEALSTLLKTRSIFEVYIRPHPADMEVNWQEKLEIFDDANIQVIICDGAIESFMKKISICIAGESSVLLEAAIAHKLCIKHSFTPQDLNDYYKFVDEGLALHFQTFVEENFSQNAMLEILAKQMKVTKRFSQSFGTKYEGTEDILVENELKKMCVL